MPEMVTIGATEPMDLVHIDFVGMEMTVATKKQPVVKTVLMVIDHFTRFVRAFIVDDRRAETVAKTLYDKYFSVFGFPRWLMLDNAPEFVGKVITALCDILNVKQLRTSTYHPQTNGSVECMLIKHLLGWSASSTPNANIVGRITYRRYVMRTTLREAKLQDTRPTSLCSEGGPVYLLIYCSRR